MVLSALLDPIRVNPHLFRNEDVAHVAERVHLARPDIIRIKNVSFKRSFKQVGGIFPELASKGAIAEHLNIQRIRFEDVFEVKDDAKTMLIVSGPVTMIPLMEKIKFRVDAQSLKDYGMDSGGNAGNIEVYY
jgi:hypothetical protein